MKIFSKVKNYAFPIVCGVLLFVLVFSRSETVKAAPLAGGNSDVGIYWLSNMGGVWVDDTADANDSDAAGDVDWSISVGTRPMYIGHLTTKFNKVILDVSLPVDELQNGKDLPVFYWDGANWVDLPLDAQTHPLDTVAVNILRLALEVPLRTIAENAGFEGSVVANEVKNGSGNYGFNAATGEYEDMVSAGIIDPTKVTRSALENAISVAGMILTTEAIVADMPKKDDDHGHGAGMPGMGGMGMM